MKLAKKKEIAAKLSLHTHLSETQALKQLPYILPALTDKNVAQELGLTNEELDWIRNR